MALSRHNSVKGNSSTTASLTATGFTAAIGEIVVVHITHEQTSGAVKTVSTVGDGTANVYTKRFSASQVPEPVSSASEGHEVWWAYVANTLTTATITVTMSAAIDDATVIVSGYQGFTGTAYQTAPWDTNASLPATAQNNVGASLATVSGVSTTSTAGMLLAGFTSVDTSHSPLEPSGFTEVQRAINNGAVLSIQGALADSVYSSAQSSGTIAQQTSGGGSCIGWIFWVDALTIPSGATANPSRSINVSQAVKRSSFW